MAFSASVASPRRNFCTSGLTPGVNATVEVGGQAVTEEPEPTLRIDVPHGGRLRLGTTVPVGDRPVGQAAGELQSEDVSGAPVHLRRDDGRGQLGCRHAGPRLDQRDGDLGGQALTVGGAKPLRRRLRLSMATRSGQPGRDRAEEEPRAPDQAERVAVGLIPESNRFPYVWTSRQWAPMPSAAARRLVMKWAPKS